MFFLWLVTFLPPNKSVFTTHLVTFLSSLAILAAAVFSYRAEKQTDTQTNGGKTLPAVGVGKTFGTIRSYTQQQKSSVKSLFVDSWMQSLMDDRSCDEWLVPSWQLIWGRRMAPSRFRAAYMRPNRALDRPPADRWQRVDRVLVTALRAAGAL